MNLQWYHQHDQAPHHVNCVMISNKASFPSSSSKMKKIKETIQEVKTTRNVRRGASSANMQFSTCTTVKVLAV